MSIRVMSAVWDKGPGDRGELLVLLALADFANDSGECWPSVAAIGRKARMDERSARRILRKLEASGWVSCDVGGGRHGCSRYIINPDNASPGQNVRPDKTRTKPGQNEPETRTPVSPEPSRTVKNRQEEPPVGGSRARARKPEIPLPDDWVPSDRNMSDAYDRNFTDEEIRHEACQFRDHHLARGNRFRDWDAAWRTWLGNARKFAPRVVAGRSAAGGRGQGGSLASIVARRRIEGGF